MLLFISKSPIRETNHADANRNLNHRGWALDFSFSTEDETLPTPAHMARSFKRSLKAEVGGENPNLEGEVVYFAVVATSTDTFVRGTFYYDNLDPEFTLSDIY